MGTHIEDNKGQVQLKMNPPSLSSEGPSNKEDEASFLQDEAVDSIYARKCDLINQCLQNEIGFGRYQYQLFILTGLGWLADNLWLQGIAVVLPQVQQELLPSRIEFATFALYIGLICGATTWGVLADLIGRRLSFNVTLFIGGVFGLAAGAAPNFVTFASLMACMGFGVGGNLPVDGALYLEHTPQSHQWTLTLLSVWWAFGQLIASFIAWGFIGNFSCSVDVPVGQCHKADNMGWRYTFYTMGSLTLLMFICRFVIFDLQESSKYLIAKRRDAEAIKALQHIARRNGKTISLTLEHLSQINSSRGAKPVPKTTWQLLKSSFSTFSLAHVRPLFSGRRFAINTTITILSWGLIGLAYPLFNAFLPLYLKNEVSSNSSISSAYRNYVIISVMGIPGSIIACLVVDWTRKSKKKETATNDDEDPENQKDGIVETEKNRTLRVATTTTFGVFSGLKVFGGRKLTMIISTLLSGIFLFLFTTSRGPADVLGYSCAGSLTQNAMYGVLYAYTPEVFPAPHRGTGDALASSFNRITGVIAPIIKIATTTASGEGANGTANGSVFVSAALLTVTAFFMIFLPIETAGRAAM